MPMNIKVHEASNKYKFSYGEELGIKSFSSSSSMPLSSYDKQMAKFHTSLDNVRVYPNGTGDGISVQIFCSSDEAKFATPDITSMNIKYVGGSNNYAQMIQTALCYVADILDYRKSIVETLKDAGVING